MPPKTYWCTKCNRFAISVNNLAPPCPIHGEDVMVDSPFGLGRNYPAHPRNENITQDTVEVFFCRLFLPFLII